MEQNGKTQWYIADAYIPPESSGGLTSHESICVLNTHAEDARLNISVYFEDRAPMENIIQIVPGQRTKHIRTGSLQAGGESIPKDVPYALAVTSDIPVVVQYSRLDATQSENALMTTIAYASM
ncbi:sensory rhodopsin transducer [Tuberibacillus sp. Marseille-P3662]|uniref:sensory rhodopsin transducer n=1 Tax=Tuberibacillus sp. Marseille-P3662 TaxID=1965358 RepID=UPI000A1CB3C4|nr:sensory rhodopsin transducer [Tuberibacillus sp. Marseille-P3662]